MCGAPIGARHLLLQVEHQLPFPQAQCWVLHSIDPLQRVDSVATISLFSEPNCWLGPLATGAWGPRARRGRALGGPRRAERAGRVATHCGGAAQLLIEICGVLLGTPAWHSGFA
jgi:hypothetical protein